MPQFPPLLNSDDDKIFHRVTARIKYILKNISSFLPFLHLLSLFIFTPGPASFSILQTGSPPMIILWVKTI